VVEHGLFDHLQTDRLKVEVGQAYAFLFFFYEFRSGETAHLLSILA